MYKIVLNTYLQIRFYRALPFLDKQIFFVTVHLLEIIITIPSNSAKFYL